MSNILFVCTANICRSPAAESIATTRFPESGHRFASAGFMYEGRAATPEMIKTLAEFGVDCSGHESRIITAENSVAADLVLTMESRHVQDIGVMSPELYERTLPLKEAAELLRDRTTSVNAFQQELSATRDPRSYLDNRWDVEDPYKRSKKKYRKAVEEISGLVDAVLLALRDPA